MTPVPVGVAELGSITSDIWATYISDESVVLVGPDVPSGARTADYSAQVSVTGEVTATVVLTCSAASAVDLARRMFALGDATPGAEEIEDTLGELANVVGGNVKALATSPGGLTLPVVSRLAGDVVWPDQPPHCAVDVVWDGGQAALLIWTPTSSTQIVHPMVKGTATS